MMLKNYLKNICKEDWIPPVRMDHPFTRGRWIKRGAGESFM